MATEITELIQIPPNKKVVIDFYATWCGPCARVTPIIDELAEKYENIKFLKVNVDQADEIAEGFEIGSLPTFIYLNLGNIVQRIEGADLNNILTSIEKLDQIINKEEEQIYESKKSSRKNEEIQDTKKESKKESKKEEIKEEIREETRKETKEERNERKRLEMERKSEKKIDMKITKTKSKETEKKKSKKKSSRESQKKAERRNFNDLNPYEIEYNNDTPEISSDSDDVSISS